MPVPSGCLAYQAENRLTVPVSPGEATRMGRFLGDTKKLYVPTGCQRCLKTGSQGRGAVYELLEVNDELRDVILSGPTIHGIKDVIAQGLFHTLEQSGWKMAASGVTPLSEIERVTGAAHTGARNGQASEDEMLDIPAFLRRQAN